MTSLTLRVGASTDDAQEATAGTINLTSTSTVVGTSKYWGARFTNVTIPKGATIDSAVLSIFCPELGKTAFAGAIAVINETNPATFTNSREKDISLRGIYSKALTHAKTLTTNAYNEINLEAGLSTLTSFFAQSGWSSGNTLAIRIAETTGEKGEIENWDKLKATTHTAFLTITYHVATSTTASDTVTVSDSAAAISAHPRTAADTATVSDGATAVSAHSRTTADSVTTSDSASATISLARSTSDSATVSDEATRQAALTRTTADSVTVSDAVERQISVSATSSDTVSVSDAAGRIIAVSASASDEAPVSDAAAPSSAFSRTATDSVSVSDEVAGQKTQLRFASDSVSVSDAVARGALVFSRTASDSVSVTDAVERYAPSSRSVSDSVEVSMAVARSTGTSRTVADTVTISEAIIGARSFGASASDTVTVSDSATIVISERPGVLAELVLEDIGVRLTIEDATIAAVIQERGTGDVALIEEVD